MNKSILKFMRKSKTMILSTDGIKLWGTKVYYALDHGFIFFIEKKGLTIQNIYKNNNVSFEIDNNKLSIIVQGSGHVEILGEPTDFDRERGILLYKVPEDVQFMKHGTVYIARLVPDFIRVIDMRTEFKKFDIDINLDEFTEKQHPVFLSSRPWSFQQSIAAILLGAVLATRINLFLLFLSIMGVLLAQASFNILNGYFDFKSGNDNKLSMTSTRVFIDRIVPEHRAVQYSMMMLILAVLIGIYAVYIKPEILLYFVIGLIGGILYNLPKIGLKRMALGDISVFIIWSVIFLGSYIFQGGIINIPVIFISFAVGILTLSILHSNNWRDIKDDKNANVKTVASLLGEKISMIYYLILIYIPYILISAAFYLSYKLLPLLSVFITIPMSVYLARIAINNKNIKRGELDRLTARFTFIFAITGAVFYLGIMFIYGMDKFIL
ncbi:UbiA family prenyltransferase [Picrophilus oshimae]|uniref:Prenyltransferase n=1 Tax=Picrophilus torridus (strain ATCC 700027 / DSM 9790 / JCM 10055 / NBRC 100828 / KAW 2/3) TaxID=1122961 RepID=Q6L2T1_PICTO|nr:UbiA family prenyltransferase [Picrophilus oshimae]AAT42721.1 prenyltransferase [Picrophilus oshimae DSM 9789]